MITRAKCAPLPGVITPAEYARVRGVSKTAVSKAIASGRITAMRDARGRIWLDPDLANIEWAQNTDPDQQHRGAIKEFERSEQLARESMARLINPDETRI